MEELIQKVDELGLQKRRDYMRLKREINKQKKFEKAQKLRNHYIRKKQEWLKSLKFRLYKNIIN